MAGFIANWQHLFGTAWFQHNIFPLFTPRQAILALRALGIPAPPDDHLRWCNIRCRDGAPHHPHGAFGIVPPYVHQVPGINAFHLAPTPCHNRAQYVNAASADAHRPAGYTQISICNEPHNVPQAGTHTAPHPEGRILVCRPCKARRAQYLDEKRQYCFLGVCAPCRKWAMDNLAPLQNDCVCQPTGNCVGGVNNNEPRYRHLCRNHEVYYWNLIIPVADAEIDVRRRLVRTRPKKRGHGWSRKKGAARVRTPAQRRAATRQLPAGVPAPNAPRCYCGENIGHTGHLRAGVAAQVRNCVGCGRFRRNV